MKRTAARAQIESDEVAADNVRSTGDREINDRKIMRDDLKAFRSNGKGSSCVRDAQGGSLTTFGSRTTGTSFKHGPRRISDEEAGHRY